MNAANLLFHLSLSWFIFHGAGVLMACGALWAAVCGLGPSTCDVMRGEVRDLKSGRARGFENLIFLWQTWCRQVCDGRAVGRTSKASQLPSPTTGENMSRGMLACATPSVKNENRQHQWRSQYASGLKIPSCLHWHLYDLLSERRENLRDAPSLQ